MCWWTGLLIAYEPHGLLFPGMLHIKTLLHKYIYLLYIYCPGSMHGQAEGSAVLLEVQPELQAEKQPRQRRVRGTDPHYPAWGGPDTALTQVKPQWVLPQHPCLVPAAGGRWSLA